MTKFSNSKYLFHRLIWLLFFVCIMTTQLQAFEFNQDFLSSQLNSKTISMDFKNASLNDVLKIFSQQSGMNFIASDTVSDKIINLYLDNVPVEAALERILSANDLTYEIQSGSNIFVVKELVKPEKELMTRIYKLRYCSVSTSKLQSTFSFEDAAGGGEATTSAGITQIIESVLTDDGSVVENTRTNSLIVTDIPSQFPMIEKTIARLDKRVPLVLIEIEMLDVSQNALEELGASWGNQPFQFTGGGSKATLFPFETDNVLDDTLSSHDPGSRYSAYEDGEYTVGTMSFAGLSVTVNFLRNHGDTKYLARPKILTLNNETAEIRIDTDEAIGLSSVTEASEGTSLTTGEAEREKTGVFLKVTPQANLATGDIKLAVEPKVIQARSGLSVTVDTVDITFKDPEERVTRSVLRVKDGNTVVLGGLLRTEKTETKTNVPVLSKVPLLGAAFRHKKDSEYERELIVFITPSIVKDNPPMNAKVYKKKSFVREKDVPSQKLTEIDKALSRAEKKRY